MQAQRPYRRTLRNGELAVAGNRWRKVGDWVSDVGSRRRRGRHSKKSTHLTRETPLEANSVQVDDNSEYRGKCDGDEDDKPSHWTPFRNDALELFSVHRCGRRTRKSCAE
jgi:hypothetical protein